MKSEHPEDSFEPNVAAREEKEREKEGIHG